MEGQDQVLYSLATGFVPLDFKVAIIRPLLKNVPLNPDVLANY